MPEAIDFESDTALAPEPLPRGRHKLSAETVRASQRERLLRAMLESVAESGYEATTVPQVVAMARVSRNAFYELFDDKLGCFLALCEEQSEQLLDETFKPGDATDWRGALREGTGRYLRWWQARPRFARAWLVALPTAGRPALEQRNRAYERFAERFAALGGWARTQDAGLAPLHAAAPRFIVSAITDLVAEEIVAGRVATLTALEDELVWLVTRLLAEPSSETAARA